MVTGPCQVCSVISCPRRLKLFLSFAAPARQDPPGHGIHIPDPGPLHVLNPHPEMLCFRCPQDHGISAQVKCHCLYTISSLLHHCISVCYLNQNVSSTKARNFLMLFETASHTVAQPGLELTMYARPASNFPAILLTQPPKRWNYRPVTGFTFPCLISFSIIFSCFSYKFFQKENVFGIGLGKGAWRASVRVGGWYQGPGGRGCAGAARGATGVHGIALARGMLGAAEAEVQARCQTASQGP